MPPLPFTKTGVPRPLECVLNIIDYKKMGLTSLRKHEVLRDFKDISYEICVVEVWK
jgi:hypothetical protein